MKKTKFAAVLAAAAVIPFSGSAPGAFLPQTAHAEDAPGWKVALPDWIPQSYEAALEFRNTHGAVQIQDGLVCMLFSEYPERHASEEEQNPERYAIKMTEGVMQELSRVKYSAEGEYDFVVSVFQPIKKGDFEIALVDTWLKSGSLDLGYQKADAYYTFSVDAALNVTETDIYGWLPDCDEEYRSIASRNGGVFVRDNYVLFCLTYSAGTAYDWQEHDRGTECFELAAVSSCTRVYDQPVSGGAVNTIYVYKAVKDGYDKISYDFSAAYTTGKVEETRTADCVVFDDAQAVLLSGNMRVTLEDAAAGNVIPFAGDTVPFLWTDVSYQSEEGPMQTGPIYELENNPAVLDDTARFFGADSFSFGLEDNSLPEGYVLPEADGHNCGYLGGAVMPEDYMTVTRFENGAADVVFRLKKAAQSDLEPGQTRITLYDRDTGELIPSSLLKNHMWSFGTDIRIKNPNNPDEWSYTGPIVIVESNPYVFTNDLAGLYKSADVFRFICEDQPEATLYDNGSLDLVFRTKIRLTGNINGDGKFDAGDAETLQKWLLGDSEVRIYDWGEGDYDFDDQLTARDLTLMKRTLAKNAVTPAAVEVTESGGVAGVFTVRKVYESGGGYYFSSQYGADPATAKTTVTAITGELYREIMALDFDSYLNAPEDESSEIIYDGFQYHTVITYGDGSQKTTDRTIGELNHLLRAAEKAS